MFSKFKSPTFISIFTLTFLGLIYSSLKKIGLGFYHVDYYFYYNMNLIRSGIKEDPEILMHPIGENAFGYEGADGYPTIFNELHLSLIQDLLAQIFLFGGEHLLFLFYSLISAIAVVLLVKHFIPFIKTNIWQLIAIFFAVLPAYLFFASYDLRVFILLISLVVILFLLIEKGASPIFIVFTLIMIFLTREEFVYFGMAASIHLFWRNRNTLCFISLAMALASAIFYIRNFEINTSFESTKIYVNLFLMISPIAILYLASFIDKKQVSSLKFSNLVSITSSYFRISEIKIKSVLALGIYLLPIFSVMLKYNWFMVYKQPKYLLIWITMVLILTTLIKKKKFYKTAIFFLVIYSLIFYTRIYSKEFDTSDGFGAYQVIKSELKNLPIKNDTLIVTDKDIHQAFVGYKVASWERIPTKMNNIDELISTADIIFTRKPDKLKKSSDKFLEFNCRTNSNMYICMNRNVD